MSRQRAALLIDTNGLNPYGRCLAAALRDAGVELEFHRRRAPRVSGHGRPFGPTRDGAGKRWFRAILLGASLIRVSLRVPKSTVVHTLWETRADLLIALFARFICRRPVVVTIHDAARSGKQAARTLRWLVRCADRMIVHSRVIEADLVARVPSARNKIDIVPLLNYSGQVRGGSKTVARSRLGLAADAPVILFFGHLRPGKGLDILLAAADEMLPADRTVQLVIAGSDPQRAWASELAALEARHPRQVVLFVRERLLAEDALSDLVMAADVVALPFTRAAQSSSAIFALSHRRAVVTTAVGAVAELGSAGAVATVRVGDSEELAAACLNLIALPQARQDLADQGFRYASTELAPRRVARKTSALYDIASGVAAG